MIKPPILAIVPVVIRRLRGLWTHSLCRRQPCIHIVTLPAPARPPTRNRRARVRRPPQSSERACAAPPAAETGDTVVAALCRRSQSLALVALCVAAGAQPRRSVDVDNATPSRLTVGERARCRFA